MTSGANPVSRSSAAANKAGDSGATSCSADALSPPSKLSSTALMPNEVASHGRVGLGDERALAEVVGIAVMDHTGE
jgi:hypothetical protein